MPTDSKPPRAQANRQLTRSSRIRELTGNWLVGAAPLKPLGQRPGSRRKVEAPHSMGTMRTHHHYISSVDL